MRPSQRQAPVHEFFALARTIEYFRIPFRVPTLRRYVGPKNFDENSFVDIKGDASMSYDAGEFHLTATPPRGCRTTCSWPTLRRAKNSFGRGKTVAVTPFEPEWEGYVPLEFSNTTLLPAKNLPAWRAHGAEVCDTSSRDCGEATNAGKNDRVPRSEW